MGSRKRKVLFPFRHHKKGQGLSLNVIIIAALALIVLVVLGVLFMQKSLVFDKTVSEETKTELTKMKVNYGDCHPEVGWETDFKSDMAQAESDADKAEARTDFREEISRCKLLSSDRDTCESRNCAWS